MENVTGLDKLYYETTPQGIMTMDKYQFLTLQEAKVLLACKLILITCIVILNGFVLVVYCKFPKIRAQPHNVFIIALTITDFVTGLITMPMDIFKNVSPDFLDPSAPVPWYYTNKELCLFALFSAIQPLQWSATTLVIIAIDRCIATFFPLKYYALMTRPRAAAAITVGWIVSSIPIYTAISMADLETHDPKKKCTTGGQFHPILEMTIMYVWSAIPVAISLIIYVTIWIRLCHRPKQVENQRRQTITMAVVIVAFTVCLLPMFVAMLRPPSLSIRGWLIFINVAIFLAHFNSCLNPIIYNVFNASFRKCSRKLLCRWRNRASHAITTVSDNGVHQKTQVGDVTETKLSNSNVEKRT